MTKEQIKRLGLYAQTNEELLVKMRGRKDCTLYVPLRRFELSKETQEELIARNITLKAM